jgi:hypothetical protein
MEKEKIKFMHNSLPVFPLSLIFVFLSSPLAHSLRIATVRENKGKKNFCNLNKTNLHFISFHCSNMIFARRKLLLNHFSLSYSIPAFED